MIPSYFLIVLNSIVYSFNVVNVKFQIEGKKKQQTRNHNKQGSVYEKVASSNVVRPLRVNKEDLQFWTRSK